MSRMTLSFWWCCLKKKKIFPHRAFIPKSLVYYNTYMCVVKHERNGKKKYIAKYLLSNFISHKMADNIIFYIYKTDIIGGATTKTIFNADCFGFLFFFLFIIIVTTRKKKRYVGPHIVCAFIVFIIFPFFMSLDFAQI